MDGSVWDTCGRVSVGHLLTGQCGTLVDGSVWDTCGRVSVGHLWDLSEPVVRALCDLLNSLSLRCVTFSELFVLAVLSF